MRALIGLLFLLSLNAFADRKMMVIQAYEIEGEAPKGLVAASISLLNVSNVDQTITWSGGVIPNRVYGPSQLPYPHPCVPHTTPLPSHSKAVEYIASQNRVKLQPDGFITLWCSTNSETNRSPGHEGVIKVEFTVSEDRGAIMGSGSLHVFDKGSAYNWGGSGAGPFLINGGRAF